MNTVDIETYVTITISRWAKENLLEPEQVLEVKTLASTVAAKSKGLGLTAPGLLSRLTPE